MRGFDRPCFDLAEGFTINGHPISPAVCPEVYGECAGPDLCLFGPWEECADGGRHPEIEAYRAWQAGEEGSGAEPRGGLRSRAEPGHES